MNIGPRLQARPDGFLELYGLLLEASEWLRARGVEQWNPEYPAQRFAREIAAGLVWYWAIDDTPIATVTLYEHRPDYYPAGVWEDDLHAWYLCRFTIARRLVGQGVGDRVLTAIESGAAAARVRALRLDVTAANPFLEKYYCSRGFQCYRRVDFFGKPSVLLHKAITP